MQAAARELGVTGALGWLLRPQAEREDLTK
jgi:hypothetical protein